MAPISVLLAMFSRCPLYLSHFPAAEMWSVVHFPFTLTRTRKLENSSDINRGKGSRTCNRSDVGEIMISVEGTGRGSGGGVIFSSPYGSHRFVRYVPLINPRDGSASPEGG